MPRQSRLDAPRALHHIIIWGIEKNIFRDKKEREAFFDRLGDILLSTTTPCCGRIFPADLRSGSIVRTVVGARAILCFLAVRRLGMTCAALATELNISPSDGSRAAERGQKILRVEDIEERILKSQ